MSREFVGGTFNEDDGFIPDDDEGRRCFMCAGTGWDVCRNPLKCTNEPHVGTECHCKSCGGSGLAVERSLASEVLEAAKAWWVDDYTDTTTQRLQEAIERYFDALSLQTTTPDADNDTTHDPTDQILYRLDEAMHRHLDSPVTGDFMSLTREWREIIEAGDRRR